jgi:uncharacterized protein YfbU (UPF0304 family)
MARLFLSYSRADRFVAAKLVEFLEREGHEVWWDRKLEGGASFTAEIEQRIVEAKKVLVIWSRESVNSDFVRDEADRGRKWKKLVPTRIDDVVIPLGFGGIHTIDLCEWPKRFEEVLAAVGGTASKSKRATAESLKTPPLSKFERLLLINPFEILSLLQPNQARDHRLMIEKLEQGYTQRLFIFDEYLRDDLPDSVDHLVFEVLEMFRAITFGFEQLEDKTGIDKKETVFPGFDGNYETQYMAYAQYLLDDEGLYAELRRKGGYNSHHPTLERYNEMLEAWKKSAAPRELTFADIRRILDAW